MTLENSTDLQRNADNVISTLTQLDLTPTEKAAVLSTALCTLVLKELPLNKALSLKAMLEYRLNLAVLARIATEREPS